MNSQTIAILFATLLVVAATLIPTYIISKRSATSEDDWAVADRSLPIYVVIGTQFASAMGGGILVGHLGNAYLNGVAILIYGFLTALPFFFILIPAKWLRQNNFSTVPEILRFFSNNNKLVGIVAAVMTIFVPFGWITSQITAFGSIYATITGLDYTMLCIIFVIVSLLFVMPAGLKTVAWTDFIFACFMIFMCIVCIVEVTNMGGGWSNIKANMDPAMLSMSGSINKLGAGTVLLWVFSVLPGGVTNQLYFQRVCAIKEEKQIAKSLAISAFLAFLAFVWAVYMGMSISTLNPNLDQNSATGWFMAQLSTPLLAGFAALVFATMMSTVSSGAQSVVVNITRDIIGVLKPNVSSERMLFLSRALSLVTMAVATVMCLVFTDTLTWLVATYAFSAATLACPIYVGYLYRNKKFITTPGLIASMIGGCVGCAVAMVMETTINYAAIGIVVSFVALMVVSALTKPKKAE